MPCCCSMVAVAIFGVNLTECFNRVVLFLNWLLYKGDCTILDLTLITHSRFLHYNSLDWNSILLNHGRVLQSWFIHPHTNFPEWFVWEEWCFISNSRLHNYYTLLWSCLRFNGQPTSVPIFSLLPGAVYPVGVTTYWCDFSCIIANNFVNIYHIPTKFGT